MKVKRGVLLGICFVIICGVSAQNTGRIYGKVLNTAGIPVPLANVKVKEDPTAGTATTEAGRYDLQVPHDKEITIVVSCVGYISQQKKITVPAGKMVLLNFELIDTAVDLTDYQVKGYVVPDGTERLNPKLMKHVPMFKQSVETFAALGGLGSRMNNELTTQYNVRGGNYDENLIYLNGMEVHRPFLIRSGQQEGLSFINPDMVSAVNFSSGGFDAVYGDKMSSVLDVRYKKPTEFAASLSASLLGAAGHLQGITKDKSLSALFGVRYQSNGYIFRQMSTKGKYTTSFTDVQLLLNYKKTEKSKWEFSLFGNYARNVYLLNPDSVVEAFGVFGDMKYFTGYFDGQEVDAYQTVFAAFTTKYSMTAKSDLKLNISYFNTIEKETFDIQGQYFMGEVGFSDSVYGKAISSRDVGGDMHHGRNFLNAHIFHGELRGEHRFKNSKLEWGIKGQGEFVDDRLSEWRLLDSAGYSLPVIPTIPSDSIGVPFEDSSRLIKVKANSYLKVKNALHSFRINGFIQNRWEFGGDNQPFVLVAGVRVSHWTFNNEWLISPRLRMQFQPKNNPNISYYLATGLYFQPAFYKEMRMEDGILNPDIKAQKSYHIIIGTNYMFKMAKCPFKFTTEAYYKHLWDLTTYNLDNVRIIYSGKNDANGYAVGIDAKLSGEFVKDLESWLTLSLLKTMEKVGGADTFTMRPTDQRFALNVFFQDKIPTLPMLKAHISTFFSTGLPYTSPNSRVYKAYGKNYFRTDIGFSWQFLDAATHIGKKQLKGVKAGFLTFEISNLFNYSNIISYSWIMVLEENGKNGYRAVPNRLTPRLFNVRLRLEF